MCRLILTVVFLVVAFPNMHAMHWAYIRKRIAQIPRTTHVSMNNGNVIFLAHNEEGVRKIKTNKLIGCIAAHIYVKTQCHDQYAVLTHYSPGYHKEHLGKLTKLMQSIDLKDKHVSNAKIIVGLHGAYEDLDTTKTKYSQPFHISMAHDLAHVATIELRCKTNQHFSIEHENVPYGRVMSVGTSYYYADTQVILKPEHALFEVNSLCFSQKIDLQNPHIRATVFY